MTDKETARQQREYLEKIHNYWLSLIPWDIPVLRPYEAETRAAQPFEIGGRLYPETAFFRRLESETKNLLERAVRDMVTATDQPAILAALYEARRKYADIFRYWEKREALEPDTMTEADRRPLTLGDMEAANRKARERVEFIKNCERSGVEVVTRPGAALEKSVIGIVAVWIADNIEYLESMGVQPQRAGTFEVKQTAEICALVYTIDRAATGETVPSKTDLVRDIKSNYPQFKRDAGKIYRLISTREATVPPKPTGQDCRKIAGNDWQRVVVALSNHPDKVKEYIENEIIKR